MGNTNSNVVKEKFGSIYSKDGITRPGYYWKKGNNKNLIIVLKRYKVLSCNFTIDTVLNIKNGDNIAIYNLKSVINHYGNEINGHYNTTIVDENVTIDDNKLQDKTL